MRHSHEELQLLEPKNMKKRTKQRPETSQNRAWHLTGRLARVQP